MYRIVINFNIYGVYILKNMLCPAAVGPKLVKFSTKFRMLLNLDVGPSVTTAVQLYLRETYPSKLLPVQL
eukprot:SAG31_NODE_2506_length_5591_cov_4.701384_5_plen_70_part_00